MNLFFISGASVSGKTSIIKDLKKILGTEAHVYDFDDIGVPENADTKRRQEATKEWLQKNTCLLDQIAVGEISALEKKLLSPSVRSSRNILNNLISEDFIEFGASGNIYKKSDILHFLPQESFSEFDIMEIKENVLSESLVLVTYRLASKGKTSLRSSLWRKEERKWKLFFHQGTKI